ncbi:MAG: hypothetical protein ACI97A_002081 [Planctomycetota bacterium]
MSYKKIFEDVARFVRTKGIEVDIDFGPKLTKKDIVKARKRSYVPLPEGLIEFLEEIGDGVEFFWTSDDEAEDGTFTNIQIDSLEDIVDQNLEQMDFAPEWVANYEFDGCADPVLAKKTAARMRNWIHFHAEGNGDSFALETHVAPSPVVYNQMAWMDAGTGDNGLILGQSLFEFFRDWSRVCFQFPASLHWPDVCDKETGKVDWNSSFFNDEFRLPS